MKNFEFQNCTKIIFGKDSEEKAGTEIIKYSSKILLHYGGGSIKKYGLYDRVKSCLKKEDIGIVELGGVLPNPRLKLVKKGIELCRQEKIDFILAVGGGSVIDSAKAIAIGVPYKGNVWDFFEEKTKIKESIPIAVILTIPAAGSEVSGASVITNEDGLYKKGVEANIMRPKFSILNPELTFTLGNNQTAIGVADILAHIMERYFTQEKNVDLTDRLCEATFKTLLRNTPVILKENNNYAARAEVMWAGSVAHNDLLDTGRVTDWASHMIEHELSAIYDIAHGEGLAIIFPAWMKYVYKNNIERFAQFGQRIWGVDFHPYDLEGMALEGIKRFEDFLKRIGLKTRLSEISISDDRFKEMAKKCTENGPVGSFVKLGKEDVLNIYNLAK
ncbi:MAG: iron-containing alcohol dehydrogenase [Actinobacteria bacterium]|nr:iron-containing alcohol dehydrogenase [Actinomycetota bacterium]MBU4450750.1 iron-containing alcohol dehydrogenase [Actinomycetota bacterium]MCG2789284.1 iron-containing alcohol dehydrogenase [Actinomycetes bacterium]